MDALYGTGFDTIQALVEAKTPVANGMVQLMSLVRDQVGAEAWNDLSGVNWEDDAERIRDWIKDALTTELPSENVTAFWFGLFQGNESPPKEGLSDAVDGQDAIQFLYISGSPRYQFGGVDDEWMLWRDDSYTPERRYHKSALLQRILRMEEAGLESGGIPANGASIAATTVLTLGYAALAVHQAMRALDRTITLATQPKRAVAIGFDSGDYLMMPMIGE